MVKFAALAFVAALALSIPLSALNFDKVRASVVQILYQGQGYCSASAINDTLWLTAAHCIDDTNVEGLTIKGHRVFVVLDDDKSDLAILRTFTMQTKSLKMQTYAPKAEQMVRVVGHPNGYKDVYVFRGFIANPYATEEMWEGRHDKWMAFDMTSCGGNSGSAVLNERDEIVSVLQLGHGRPCDGFTGGATWYDMVRLVYKYFKK